MPTTADRSWEAITTWLYKAFSVDSKQYGMSIMALFNRSHPVFWEFMPLEGTRNWRNYVRNACQSRCLVVLFVQVYDNSQVNQTPKGGEECGSEGGEEGGGDGVEEGEESGAGREHSVEEEEQDPGRCVVDDG
jgi:hypothetical protein